MKPNILFVDDDSNLVEALKRNLRKEFAIVGVLSGKEGLKQIEKHTETVFEVIVSDMRMPEMDGVEFLTEAKKKSPSSIRIMLTGNADQETAVKALNVVDAFKFINKPCSSDVLKVAIFEGVKQFYKNKAEQDLLKNTLGGSVKLILDLLTMLEPELFGNASAMRALLKQIAPKLPEVLSWDAYMAVLFMPIGFISMPPSVVEKYLNGVILDEAEEKLIREVPDVCFKLLSNIPRLGSVAKILYYHQKNYDGSGFPEDGMKGDEIPFASRVLKILFDFEAWKRAGYSRDRILGMFQENAYHYDPKILNICSTQLMGMYSFDNADSDIISTGILQIGHVLAKDLFTNDGRLLIKQGVEINENLLQSLANYRALAKLPVTCEIMTKDSTE